MEACPASGDEVRPPDKAFKFPPLDASRVTAAKDKKTKGEKKPKRNSYYDSTDSTSVRTVSAGLPGHGKRR